MIIKTTLQVVLETPEFLKQADKCMDDMSRKAFIDYIAGHPMDGDMIKGTGGARKIRWANAKDKGKRGGVRIIYYYHSQQLPIFLFTAYGKNKKANLTQAERNALQQIIQHIVDSYDEV